jgi:bidirectional [NiFe] hydrogenase diaphorase subunit
MPPQPSKVAAPSADKRWKLVDATMRRNGNTAQALIETLHTVQESFGYLDDDALRYVAAVLGLPLSKVYGVATFYNYFTMKPSGKHTCVVCVGTACYIKGSKQIVGSIEKLAEIKPGETTPNNAVSLMVAHCIGACGLAPAGVFDNEVVGKLSVEDATQRVERWLKDE